MPCEPIKEAPTRFASLRLTNAERDAFQQIASQLNTTRSDLLRKYVRELIGQGPDLLAHDLRDMNEAAYQVGCVGRNLNQLVRAINQGKVRTVADQAALIESVRDRVDRVAEELRWVVDRSYERWVVVDSPQK